MKTYLLAALMACAPMTANAAVVVTFTGSTFAPTDGGIGGSYLRAVDDSGSSEVFAPTAQAVSGTITIDTAAAGANQASAPDVYYDGNGGSFLTVNFTSTGAIPVQLTGMGTYQTIGSGSGLTFDLFDDAGSYTYSFGLFSNNAIPTASFGGTLLPDFAQANGLFFTVKSKEGIDSYVEMVSQGDVTAISQVLTGVDTPAVPEPASWAMMIAGFGVVGAAARRRQRGVLATA